MNPDDLIEAEIQVLASIAVAAATGRASDRLSLEASGQRYGCFREDWSEAFASLLRRGLIDGDDGGYRTIGAGERLGRTYHGERPDHYWYHYQRFYTAALASNAHSRLCERVFGADLCQDGMVDMAALDDLLGRLALGPGEHVLDLGCGAGLIAGYVSDRTGSRVTGLDISAPAIALARERSAGEGSRLSFLHADMNALDLPPRCFDAVISLDSLYWVRDLGNTLSQLLPAMRPGGRMGIFMLHELDEGCTPETPKARSTDLGRALAELDLDFDSWDYTDRNARFWRRNRQAAAELLEDFEAEGNGFIARGLIREADGEFLPAIKAGTLARYLYRVRL